jgi:predicted nucleotidyltransferase
MSTEQLLRQYRADILRLAAKHGARNVRVFGSLARGEATAQSDVDLLVEAGSRHSRFFPGGLVSDLETLLGRRVDVVEPEGLHPSSGIACSRKPSRCKIGINLNRVWEIVESDLPDLKTHVDAMLAELGAA